MSTTIAIRPRTYSAAVKVAEVITLDELIALLDKFPYSSVITVRRSIKHATSRILVRNWEGCRRPYVSFDHGSRTGYDTHSIAYISDSVFDVYGCGRMVRVAS